MVDGEPGSAGVAGEPQAAGEALRARREAQGLSLDEVSRRTRVPVRHLQAIEAGDYGALPSPVYAVGFARSYARAVGADDAATAGAVRAEVARLGPRRPEYTPYETADPARVPSRTVAIVGLGLALGLLILGALWYASLRFSDGDGGAEPSAANAVVAAVPTAPAPPPRPTGGQVTLTATDAVWLRVHDADDRTLFVGNMKAGDRFDVPAGANDPRIDVGRPDKLTVTLNGSAAPPLGDGSRPVKDVRVSGEAVAERLRGAPAGGPAAPPVPVAEASPVAAAPVAAAAAATATAAVSRVRRDVPPPAPRRQLTETQRANLESAARLRAQQRRERERAR